jgi:hypothetical protein
MEDVGTNDTAGSGSNSGGPIRESNCFKFDQSFDPITIDQTNALGSIGCLNQPLISIVLILIVT